MAKTYASSVPVHNLPVGKKGEKDSGGNLEFIGTYRGIFEVSSRCAPYRAHPSQKSGRAAFPHPALYKTHRSLLSCVYVDIDFWPFEGILF